MGSFTTLQTILIFTSSVLPTLSAPQGNWFSGRNRRFFDTSQQESGKTLGFFPSHRRFVNPCRYGRAKEESRLLSVNVYNVYQSPCKGQSGFLGGSTGALSDPVNYNGIRPGVRPGGSFLNNFVSLFSPGGALDPYGGYPTQQLTNRPIYRPPIQMAQVFSSQTTSTTNQPFVNENAVYNPFDTNRPLTSPFSEPDRPGLSPLSELTPEPEPVQPFQNFEEIANNRPNEASSSNSVFFNRPPLPSPLSESSISNSFFNNRPLLTNPASNGGFSTSSGSVSGNGLGTVSNSVTNNGQTVTSMITNQGGSISSSLGSTNGDGGQNFRPVFEDISEDTSPTEYSPFSPGQLVGGVAQTVSGFFQSLTGDGDIPGRRGFFSRWFG